MSNAPTIPFVNLSRMHAPIRLAIDQAIADCIDHNRYINGREIGEFEQEFGRFIDAPHVVGVGSGTEALFLALKALGIGTGDWVVMPDLTFIATAEAISLAGAQPLLVDVDPQSGILDPELLDECLSGPHRRKIKAVITVALYGSPLHLPAISRICRKSGLPLLCDAAQAHGALTDGRSIVHRADLTCYSFFPGKNLGAFGDAGAVACANPEWADQIRLLRDHGRAEKYLHRAVGFNCRMDTVQAAVLRVKLERLAEWNANRRKMAETYREALAQLPGVQVLRQENVHDSSVYHLFVIRIGRRTERIRFLEEAGIGFGIHYPVPVHGQPAYACLGYAPEDFPASSALAGEVLSLPMDGTIREEEVHRVVEVLGESLAIDGS